MNNHQGIKAEIDARNDIFTSCIELGKTLLARKHYAAEEVRRVHPFLLLLSKSFHSLTGCDYSLITVFVLLVQIKEKLLQLTDKRKEMIDKWEDRWEWLRLSKICLQPVSDFNLGLGPALDWELLKADSGLNVSPPQFLRCTSSPVMLAWPRPGSWGKSPTWPAGRWGRAWMRWKSSLNGTKPLRSLLPLGRNVSLP